MLTDYRSDCIIEILGISCRKNVMQIIVVLTKLPSIQRVAAL